MSGIDGSFEIENADFIGSDEETSAPCEGNGFFDAIESSCRHVGNYYSTNDSMARLGSGPADCGGGGGGWFGGGGGGGGSTPSNYHDYDVSGSVSGHTVYKASTGCVQQIVNNFTSEVDRGGSGGSGSSGGSSDSDGSGGSDGSGDDGGTWGGSWW